jgi:hypothetical protein
MFDVICYSKKRRIAVGTEFKTGNTIGGAVEYGKYINFGSLPNSTTKNVAHGISNFDRTKITGLAGTAYDGTKATIYTLTTTTASQQAMWAIDATNVSCTTASDRSGYIAPRLLITYLK